MAFKKITDVINPYIYEDLQTIVSRDLPWEQFSDKTILITGAAGFIGYYLVNTLLELNDRKGLHAHVIGLVRNMERAEKRFEEILERPDFELAVQDVCEEVRLQKKSHFIIHAASQASNIQFESDPVGTINANVTGTMQILEYARSCNVKATLFISSLKVYGAVHDGRPRMTEETVGYLDHTDYKNCYAQGKRAAETICASYIKEYGMNIKIARPSYIYGASSLTDDRVWAQFMANVVRGEDIVLKSNGGAYRSFCYVADTAAALFTILLKGACGQPYNIADDASDITIRELAKLTSGLFPEKNIKRIFVNSEDEIEPTVTHSSTPEILDSTKLRGLGWTASFGLADGMKRSISILEQNIEI